MIEVSSFLTMNGPRGLALDFLDWHARRDGERGDILNWPNHLDIHIQHYSILNKGYRMTNTAKDQRIASLGSMEMVS